MSKKIISVLLLLLVAGLLYVIGTATPASMIRGVEKFLAATFFIPSVTASDLQDKYADADKTGKRVKILIVPGHEPDYGGAEYGSLKEREMNLDLADRLVRYLSTDARLEVIETRDANGWNPELEKYFDYNEDSIKDFISNKKAEMRQLMNEGRIVRTAANVYHNSAPTDVAFRLFGINRWSRDIGADILIHIHFNDYPRSRASRPGEYRGFAIYVPEKQYSNSIATKEIARSIFDRLEESFAVSNLPKEDAGIVESQELIAIGQSNSLDAASLLVEYGYIYRFTDPAFREKTFDEMARLTALGLEDFLK